MKNFTPEVDYISLIFFGIIVVLSELNIDYVSCFAEKMCARFKTGYILGLSMPIYFFHFTVIILFRELNINVSDLGHISCYLAVVIIVSAIGQALEHMIRNGIHHIASRLNY